MSAPAAPAPPDRTLLAGLAFGAAGSVLFAGKAIVVKLAYRHGTDATTLLGLRMAFAAPWFALVALWVERGVLWARGAAAGTGAAAGSGTAPRHPMQGPRLHWTRADVLKLVGIGLVGYYLSSYLDFLGLRYVSAGLERLLLYLSPTIVLLIHRLLFRRPVARMQWIALAVCYAGVLLVFAVDLNVQGSDVALGSALVFASAVTYAIYLVSIGEVVRRFGSLRLTAWASLVAAAACIAQAFAVGGTTILHQSAAVYGLSLFNAVFCTVVPLFLMMFSVERLGAGLSAQVGMIGPASTIVLAAVFLGEPVTALQLAGTAFVLAGALLLAKVRR